MSANPATTSLADGLSALASRVLPQDVDLAFGFEAKAAPGQFVVRGFTGREALSEPYEIAVDLVAQDHEIDLEALLDTPATLSLLHAYDEPRYLHGVISQISREETGTHRTFVHVVLKPALHRLEYHSDARIFQDVSVPDIVSTLLDEHGVSDCDWRMAGEHAKREYCVQYNETSLAFIARLLAEEGICYFFEHRQDGHRLILTDAPLSMPPLAAMRELSCNANPGGTAKTFWASRFVQTERLRATHRVARDYTFKQPAYDQQHASVQPGDNGAKPGKTKRASSGRYELYDYPGRHKSPATGLPFTDHRLQAHRTDATGGEGVTNAIQLSAGFVLRLTDHANPKANIPHRLLEVVHKGDQPAALEEEAPADGATTYEATFTTQPAELPYRPTSPNPRPVIEGPQIAHVTGPEGEEIYCDEHGRVKVWFPWDRHGAKNEGSSCWVRVSQSWAGGTWGSIAIPRIGQEVIVEYLEGDPDQPIITGRTYHAANKPPYKLPEHKTRMSIKSDTHKGKGFNELRFEDEAGREEVFVHAEKNMNNIVQNDMTEAVGGVFARYVRGESSLVHFDSDREIVHRNRNTVTGGDYHISTGDRRTARFDLARFADDDGQSIKSTLIPGVAGNGEGTFSVHSNKNIALHADEAASLNAKSGITLNSDESISAFGGKSFTFSTDKEMIIGVGEFKSISVGKEFRIVCGQSSMTFKSDGTIRIAGAKIEIEGTNNIVAKSAKIDLN